MFASILRENQTLGGEENLLATQISVCYILKHLEDRKALSVHIYYTYASFFYTQFENSNDVTSVYKYEQITLFYFPSVKYTMLLLTNCYVVRSVRKTKSEYFLIWTEWPLLYYKPIIRLDELCQLNFCSSDSSSDKFSSIKTGNRRIIRLNT